MLLLAFAAVLPLAVLVSCLAIRTILSTAVLFLVAGAALGPHGIRKFTVGRSSPLVGVLAALIAERLKLAALLVFGALISLRLPAGVWWAGWLLAIVAVVVVRPVALGASFLGVQLSAREQLAVMSTVAHSSTEIVVARSFERPRTMPTWHTLRARRQARPPDSGPRSPAGRA